MTRSIDPKAKLPELPKLGIEMELLKVVNTCLETQLMAKHAGNSYEEGIITACNNIIGRYVGKLDMITAGGHLIEM
jgi:hypothetical protein